jgi:hypothetical protein
MTINTELADSVSRWPGSLGVTLPDELTEALALFETVRYVEVSYRPVFNLDGLKTPAQAEKAIRQYASELSLTTGEGELSVLERAKADVIDQAARQVVGYGRHAVPSIIEQLADRYEETVTEFREAVSVLPEDLSAERLVQGGGAAVDAYQRAVAASQRLGSFDAVVIETARLSQTILRDAEVVCRLLRPRDRGELARLDDATRSQKPELREIGAVWYTAARLGTPWGLGSYAQAVSTRKAIESVRPTPVLAR